jgi:hypothetical protein
MPGGPMRSEIAAIGALHANVVNYIKEEMVRLDAT